LAGGIANGSTFFVGFTPGVDRRVQSKDQIKHNELNHARQIIDGLLADAA